MREHRIQVLHLLGPYREEMQKLNPSRSSPSVPSASILRTPTRLELSLTNWHTNLFNGFLGG